MITFLSEPEQNPKIFGKFYRVLMDLDNYVPCMKRFPREVPNILIPPQVEKAILEDFNVLPLCEKKMTEWIRKKHYSLLSNRYLACKWAEFQDVGKEDAETGKFPKIQASASKKRKIKIWN